MTFEKENQKQNSITKTGKTRLLLIMAITGAFVAGSLTTGSFAFAQLSQCANNPPHGIGGGPVWGEVWTAICELENRIDNISSSAVNIKYVTLADGECIFDESIINPVFPIGWCPRQEGIGSDFFIEDPDVTENSVITMTANLDGYDCGVRIIFIQPPHTGFLITGCSPDDGSNLNYVVINP